MLETTILQVSPTDYYIWLLLNPVMQIFYFGVITGLLFSYARHNVPNRRDVWIGKRIGNVLKLHTYKQPSDKSQDFTFKGGLYKFDDASVRMEMKHGLFHRPVHIFDEDNATEIKTIKANEPNKEEEKIISPAKTITKKITDKDGNVTETTEVIPAKTTKVIKKGINYEIDIDINPQWTISSRKLYNWWKNKMMETTWRAIIKGAVTSDLFTILLYLSLGALVGGLLVYAIIPTHIITTTTTTTHLLNSTSTVHT